MSYFVLKIDHSYIRVHGLCGIGKVLERFHKLLCRGAQFAALQLNRSLTIPPESLQYIGEMYAGIYLRFPSTSSTIIAAVNEGLSKMVMSPRKGKSIEREKIVSSPTNTGHESQSDWHEIKPSMQSLSCSCAAG